MDVHAKFIFWIYFYIFNVLFMRFANRCANPLYYGTKVVHDYLVYKLYVHIHIFQTYLVDNGWGISEQCKTDTNLVTCVLHVPCYYSEAQLDKLPEFSAPVPVCRISQNLHPTEHV
jgi:hypothetical protein